MILFFLHQILDDIILNFKEKMFIQIFYYIFNL